MDFKALLQSSHYGVTLSVLTTSINWFYLSTLIKSNNFIWYNFIEKIKF